MLKIKGFTLLEVLVSMAIALILLSGVVLFFSDFYGNFNKKFSLNRKSSSLVYVSEIISFDLMKAGYNYDDLTIDPVRWDNLSKKLIIRFVDYDITGCETKQWSEGDSTCNCEITYFLQNNKLYRQVSIGETIQVGSLFPPDITVDDFDVSISKPTVSFTIKCKYTGLEQQKEFVISNVIICRNWNN